MTLSQQSLCQVFKRTILRSCDRQLRSVNFIAHVSVPYSRHFKHSRKLCKIRQDTGREYESPIRDFMARAPLAEDMYNIPRWHDIELKVSRYYVIPLGSKFLLSLLRLYRRRSTQLSGSPLGRVGLASWASLQQKRRLPKCSPSATWHALGLRFVSADVADSLYNAIAVNACHVPASSMVH